MDDVLSYSQVRSRLLGGGRSHLLLGNGFSIACDPVFSYGSLYSFVEPNLPSRVRQLFEHWGTNNFELVMRQLAEGAWMDGLYAREAVQRAQPHVDAARFQSALAEADDEVVEVKLREFGGGDVPRRYDEGPHHCSSPRPLAPADGALLAGAAALWRRRVRPAALTPVSDEWLRTHGVQAGRQ